MAETRKRKLNIIDFLILLALLAAACAVLFRVFGSAGGGEHQQIRYVLEVKELQTEFAAKVAAGDPVTVYAQDARIGTVVAASTAPVFFVGTDENGTPVQTEMENYSKLYITVEAEVTAEETGYRVDGYVLRTGETITVQLPGLYCEAECIRIEVLE